MVRLKIDNREVDMHIVCDTYGEAITNADGSYFMMWRDVGKDVWRLTNKIPQPTGQPEEQ